MAVLNKYIFDLYQNAWGSKLLKICFIHDVKCSESQRWWWRQWLTVMMMMRKVICVVREALFSVVSGQCREMSVQVQSEHCPREFSRLYNSTSSRHAIVHSTIFAFVHWAMTEKCKLESKANIVQVNFLGCAILHIQEVQFCTLSKMCNGTRRKNISEASFKTCNCTYNTQSGNVSWSPKPTLHI